MHMDDDSDDLDEDIERLKIVLQDDEEGEADSDGELRTLEAGKAYIGRRKREISYVRLILLGDNVAFKVSITRSIYIEAM